MPVEQNIGPEIAQALMEHDGRPARRRPSRASPGREAALNNLLNIIGRRQGARSVITIGRP